METCDRYATQRRVHQIGETGQQRLAQSKAVVVGVGALGSSIAHQLVRGGVGTVLLIDSDRVELGNLHRQILYVEEDVKEGRPKVEAAARYLRAANSSVVVQAVAARFGRDNGAALLSGADIVLDGTDNLETRYLINELCVSASIPWIYAGVVATYGMLMPVVPGVGPCLRCLFADLPESGSVPTSQTVGVFGPAPATMGALAAAAAVRVLLGSFRLPARLLSLDVWTGDTDAVEVARSPECPVCGEIGR